MPADVTQDETYDEYGTSKAERQRRLKRYRQQIDASKKWRADFEKSWRCMIDLYRNQPGGEGQKVAYDKEVHIALGFSTINVIYPSVSLARPRITVTPRVPERTDQAELAETAVNYWWKTHHYQEELRLAVKDYLIEGHGWVKITWLHKEEDYSMDEQEFREQLQEQLAEKYAVIEQRPEDEALFPTDEDIAATLPMVKKIVREDRPQVERVSPFDMFVDPDATRLHDARWIAQRVLVPVAEAKQRKGWNAKLRRELVGSASSNVMKAEEGWYDEQHDKEMKFVVVWEHYDLVNGTLCTFADEGEDFLEEPVAIPYRSGHPFVLFRNYEVPEVFYPIGDLEMIEPLNMELNTVRTSQMNDIKQFRRAYYTKEEWWDSQSLAGLRSPVDGQVFWATEQMPNDMIGKALAAVPTMGVNPDTYPVSETIQDDVTRVSAVSEYQQGAMPEIRRTATEADIIQQAANARAADKLAQIETYFAAVARKVIQLGQEFLSATQVARLVEPGKASEWVPFDAESISGEFDFEVEAGSTQPKNEQWRQNNAMRLIEILSNPMFQMDPRTGAPLLNPRAVLEYMLVEGMGIKDAERFMIPEPIMEPATGAMIDPETGQPIGPPPGEMGMGQAPPQAGNGQQPAPVPA